MVVPSLRVAWSLAVLLPWPLPLVCAAEPDPPRSEAQDSFTVVLLPDTQFYSQQHPETFLAQTRWIGERVEQDNIKFVIHLGDIVQSNTEDEWLAADRAMRLLDGVAPYSVMPGNHDMPTQAKVTVRDTSLYNQFFAPARFADQPWYGGHLGETNDNNYALFAAAGRKYLVISLEFAPRDETLQWAAQVLQQHADRQAIVATHCYLRPTGRDLKPAQDYGLEGNCGQQIWDKLVRRQRNVFLVVSGHVVGSALQISLNDAGRQVIELMTDYQGLPNGGDGWLRTLRFAPRENKIYVRTYSPTLDQDDANPRGSFELPWPAAPPPLKKAG